MNVLITGVSFGLGKSLKNQYLNMGKNVYGLSRTEVTDCKHKIFDLSILSDDTYSKVLEDLLEGQKYFDLVILNAGILGNIQKFNDVSMDDLDNIMNTNVFSNKLLLDNLYKIGVNIKQVVCISSGASQNTYKGWGGYSISKAALRMMMKVYSKDILETHFTSLAPGLVDTKMQKHLCNEVDITEFPETSKFIESRDKGITRSSDDVAKDVVKIIPDLLDLESGSYIDLRYGVK